MTDTESSNLQTSISSLTHVLFNSSHEYFIVFSMGNLHIFKDIFGSNLAICDAIVNKNILEF